MGRRRRAKEKISAISVVRISVTRAQRDFGSVLDLARRNDVAITRRRRIVAYVLSAARYQRLIWGARKRAEHVQAGVVGLVHKLLTLPSASGGSRPERVPDRLVRLMAVFVSAVHTFEDFDHAAKWMQEPNELLGNRSPRHMAESQRGAQRALAVLASIEYGLPT